MKVSLWGIPDSTKDLDVSCFDEDGATIPDEYCYQYLDMRSGDVAYLDIEGKLWRVECVIANLWYMSAHIDPEEAKEDLAAWRKTVRRAAT